MTIPSEADKIEILPIATLIITEITVPLLFDRLQGSAINEVNQKELNLSGF